VDPSAPTRIASIELARQARVRNGPFNYDPLVELTAIGLRQHVWPSAPRYEQLDFDPALHRDHDFESDWRAPPEVERLVLEQGRDFDAAVLGISLGGLPAITGDLAAHGPRFRSMLEEVRTVQTRAAQLWFTVDLKGLGWNLPPPVLDGFERPFDTWADMTHTLDYEAWPEHERPRQVSYLCGVLEERATVPETPHDTLLRGAVKQSVGTWLSERAGTLWPDALGPAGFRYELLAGRGGLTGPAALDSQYYRANVSASDRYVLSVPGSTRHRLRAEESGFENLVLAGDWLRTGLSAGCVEAATMGGLQAARALCGRPRVIVRDDEP
jgi:uncharacterized protein with NAD-binding domain and iron-sulfur cluster